MLQVLRWPDTAGSGKTSTSQVPLPAQPAGAGAGAAAGLRCRLRFSARCPTELYAFKFAPLEQNATETKKSKGELPAASL